MIGKVRENVSCETLIIEICEEGNLSHESVISISLFLTNNNAVPLHGTSLFV